MRLSVVITDEARHDLRSILDYISEDSALQAVRIAERLEEAVLEIGEAALRYQLVPNHEQSGIRRRVMGSSNINYRINADTVEILHLLHAARDRDRILFSD